MKVRIFSEELPPEGKEVDWPTIPREGEIVTFHHPGGGSNLRVERVNWHVDTNGHPIEVQVYLSF